MPAAEPALVLDPLRALALDLPHLAGGLRRATLRALLALSGGTISVEGAARLAAAPAPAIFALTHHNYWEAVLAPAALVALRRGRAVRFLVDWMFVELPWTGWLVRQIGPIPVYAKPARWRWRERQRLARRREPALERALAALARGEDVGLYPEGARNPDPWRLGAPRRGLALLALRSGAPVVPIGLDFPARDRLRRTPRAGRFVVRVGEPCRFAAEREAWLAAPSPAARRALERSLAPELGDRVHAELAHLARKVYLGTPSNRKEQEMSESQQPMPEILEPSTPTAPPEAAARRRGRLSVERVADAAARAEALRVVEEVYRAEKGWLRAVEDEIPEHPAGDTGVSWLLARRDGEAVGVVRLVYDPPLELPAELGVELDPAVDLARLRAAGRFVEIGRLMIRPRWRSRPAVVLGLMRGAIAEVVGRGYTHLLTAVFEDDPHSPLGFHTRQLGFERVGTHRHGELACASRRILLVLDLGRGYRRLVARGAAVAGHLARGLEERLAALAPAAE